MVVSNFKLTRDEMQRITLWLDLNSNEIGWIGNDVSVIKAQEDGKAIWPPVDVDPANPTGVETDRPLDVPITFRGTKTSTR